MRRAILCALVLLAGCKSASNGTSVLLTLSASSTVTDADLAAVTQLTVDVSGAETFKKTFALGRAFSSARQERELYKANAQSGTLNFAVTALDAGGKSRGYGSASVALQSGKTVPLTLSLTNAMPPTVDAGKSTVVVDKPTGLVANGSDTATITVTLVDAGGVPQANQMVQLAATGMANTLTQPMGPTDATGVTTGKLSTTVGEMKTITATVNPGPAALVLTQQPTVTFAPSTAVKLSFKTQPASAATDTSIAPAVQVAVLDNNGLAAPGAYPITLTLASTNPQHATLAGDVIATTDAASGVATFANLSLNLVGSYTITATSPMLTSATSSAFNVTAQAWTESNTGLWGGTIQSFFPDPHHPNVVYAGGQGGTFKTTNGGMDWYSADAGLPAGRFVFDVAFHPTNPLVQVAVVANAAAGQNLFQTTNGGASWSAISPTGIDNIPAGWAWDPANAKIVYVWGGGKTGVTNSFYKSTDGGATFTPTGNSDFSASYISGAAQFAEDAASGALYVCETNDDGSVVGVYRSSDGGAHWTINASLGGATPYGCYALAVDPSGNVLWGSNGVYRIAGSSWATGMWTTLNTGLPANPGVTSLVLTPGDPMTLYVVDNSTSSVYKTVNGGAMWTKVTAAPVGTAVGSLTLAIDESGTQLYAGGTALDGPYVSSTGGSLWTFAATGLRLTDVASVAVDKKAPGTVYALGNTNIFRSMDGGATWSVVYTGVFGRYSPIAVDPLDDYYVYAGNSKGGFYSTNSGGSFMALPATYMGGWITSLAIDPNTTPSTIFAGTNTNAIWKSVDNGAHWAQAGTTGLGGAVSAQSLGVDASVNPSIVYANVNGATSNFFKSTDHGATWTMLGAPGSILRTFAIDPKAPAIIYGGYDQGNVYKSVNGGGTFVLTNGGLGTANVAVLIVDPVTDANVYAATTSFGSGLYKSTDAAMNWKPANKGLKDISVDGLAIDPITPTTLYAGTPHGVFKTTTGAQ